jgi:hypothetical protein
MIAENFKGYLGGSLFIFIGIILLLSVFKFAVDAGKKTRLIILALPFFHSNTPQPSSAQPVSVLRNEKRIIE